MTRSADNHATPGAPGDFSRRDFVVASVATGLAGTTGAAGAAGPAVTEREVTITTPDGTCDAAFFHPATGTCPGVLIWPDAFGLRPAMRDMARRLAAEGYAVLVPNPFYRLTKAPVVQTAANFDFKDPKAFDTLRPLMGSVGAPGAAEKDAVAYVAFMDAQPQVDKGRKIGTQGYCMGGPYTVRTAFAVPARIGAAASFHGAGLVGEDMDSPDKLIVKTQAAFLFAIAQNDDACAPGDKDALRAAAKAAGRPAEIEVYPAQHGWCTIDAPIYSQAQAEKAWGRMLALFATNL